MQSQIIRELDGGLILRRSTSADADALADFCAHVHSDEGWDKPDERIGAWTRDLLTLPHPTFRPDDFTVIEETATKRIVSALNLISQTWTYEGIPFGVGRPELVGTLPEFRRRGLIRAQFDEVHKWSAARGEMVQAITGIPYFYRQFGYEMTLDLDGSRSGFEFNLPKLKDGERDPFCFRPAAEADLPFILQTYNYGSKRSLVAAVRDEAMLRYEIVGRSENSMVRLQWEIIERADTHEAVGVIAYPLPGWSASMPVMFYELKPGVSWLEVTPAVARRLWQLMKECSKRDGKSRSAYTFCLGEDHPAYHALGANLPRVRSSYAWYLRVPDLLAFLNHIKPVLEKRLADSIAAGHSREIAISFYREALHIVLEKGRIVAIETQPTRPHDEDDISFPGLTFLQLVFGHRSFDDLNRAYPDCWSDNEEVRVLLEIIFPKRPSQVFPIA